MLIDKILDRRDDLEKYNPKELYNYCVKSGDMYGEIADLLDSGENRDIQKALCIYIIEQEYRTSICEYINSVNWV